VPWTHDLRVFDAVARIREAGFAIVAVEMTPASVSLFRARAPERSCFVFGHEVLGVDKELLRQADAVLHLPMAGFKNSLNVSSSFAVTLYQHLASWGRLDEAAPRLEDCYLPDRRKEDRG
jgi:tRNA (guanosine-2'-O-)-methyltransferase